MFKPQFKNELFALLRQAESHALELQEEAKKYLDPARLPSAEREGAMPTIWLSPHCTCASDSMTSLITGCPRGSLFSSFT